MKHLVLFVFLFLATVCNAQIELEVNEEGVYFVKADTQVYMPSEITAEPESIKYIDKFLQAVNNPDVPILVKQNEKILKLKLVFRQLVEIENEFIIYRKTSDSIRVFVNVEKKEEYSYVLLFAIIPIVLMIISNILYKQGIDNSEAKVLAFVSAVCALLAVLTVFAFESVVSAAPLVSMFSAMLAFAAAFSIFANKNYKVASVIFYIFMIIYVVFLFF